MKSVHLGIFLFLGFFLSSPVFSQESQGGGGAGIEIGAHVGNLLPNQVPGITEIHPQWGVRMGFRTSKSSSLEFGGMAGNGNGALMRSLSLSMRADVPIETLVGHVGFGADVIQFQGVGEDMKLYGGGHVLGGILSHISEELWLRLDMKFNVNPGTSLYFGVGMLLRFGEGNSEGQ